MNTKNKKAKNFLPVFLLIFLLTLAITAPVYGQEPLPIKQLKVGDWWLVKIEQKDIWKRVARHSWVDAGNWKFEVKAKENGKLTVDVTNLNRPADAPPWGLTIVYDGEGEVIDATYKVGDRMFTGEAALKFVPLGKDGLMVGPPMKKLLVAPKAMRFDIKTKKDVEMSKVVVDKKGTYQLWRPKEPWWRYFERKEEVPVRAEVQKTSWWKD
ncbi:MAG: hypothetical protein GY950_07930 [bacterium]|nr:hypothetical protein [bacterium]